MTARLFGAVMAGGLSRRMGADKAFLAWEGRAAWVRQAEVLRACGAAEVVLVRRPGQPAPAGIGCVRDRFAGCGPLAGLQAVLAAARERGFPAVAVLAVDMPGIDGRWFARLRAHCRPGRGAAVRHAEGFEPLAAVYPAEALETVERRLRRGQRALQGCLRELAEAGLIAVLGAGTEEASRAASVNSPEPARELQRRR